MSLKHALASKFSRMSRQKLIFADIVDISLLFDKVTFMHCLREANKVAHELAKFSFQIISFVIESMNP
jgi:Tat protein secretion system quality control protein TatD with DNase activity